MSDAKATAKQLASLAGVKLGKPTHITESTYAPSPVVPRVAYAYAEEAVVETPISPGETEISLTVQVVYAIRN